MAEGGLDPPDPRIRLVNGSWRGLTHKHGVVVRIIDNTDNEDYLDAISSIVPTDNILAAGRMTKRFVCFFSKLNDVEKVVYQGIEVKGEHVNVDYYSKPAKKIVISNVPPCIPNEILRPIIARKGVIVGDIKPIPLSSTKYRHIQSLRRSVTVILDRPAENLADTVDICYEGQSHQIYLSTNQPRCFVCNEMGHISKYCSNRVGQGAPSSRGGAPLQYNQVVQGNMQRNIVQNVKHVSIVNQDVSEKKVSTQSEKLENVKKTDTNENVRKVKKVVKRKSTEPFIVETPNKYIYVDSEVRTLPSSLPPSPFLTKSHGGLVSCPNSSSRQVSRSSPIPSPRPSSCTSPYPSFSSIPHLSFSSTPRPSSHSSPRSSPLQFSRSKPPRVLCSTNLVDKLLHTNPHILANQKSPIPVTANPFDLLANDVLSDGMSCVMKSTSSTSKVSNKSDTTQVSPISFTLPADAEESHQISPLPSPLEFHESSEELHNQDMLTLHDLPVESGSMSIDMNESSFSLSDLNVSVHQDITLTPPTDEEFLEFFMKLKGAHKQVEKCADFKLDFRYLIRRLIKLDSQNLIERADKPRLKSLVKKLAMHIDLKLPIMKTVGCLPE